jgi:hypothetical protein
MVEMSDSQDKGWFKSSASAGSCACVEVHIMPGGVLVRDSKQQRASTGVSGGQHQIYFTAGQWAAFLDALLQGGADRIKVDGSVFSRSRDGSASLVSPGAGVTLGFTAPEVSAFLVGVRHGEFDVVAPAAT